MGLRGEREAEGKELRGYGGDGVEGRERVPLTKISHNLHTSHLPFYPSLLLGPRVKPCEPFPRGVV